jgi:hypothetical protein
MEAIYSSETSLKFTVLYGFTSQKRELFIVTAVRTSNPASVKYLSSQWLQIICSKQMTLSHILIHLKNNIFLDVTPFSLVEM